MSSDYQKGYNAALKRNKREKVELEKLKIKLEQAELKLRTVSKEHNERIYLKSLELVMNPQNNWVIGNKRINDVKGYCELAMKFTKESNSILRKMK